MYVYMYVYNIIYIYIYNIFRLTSQSGPQWNLWVSRKTTNPYDNEHHHVSYLVRSKCQWNLWVSRKTTNPYDNEHHHVSYLVRSTCLSCYTYSSVNSSQLKKKLILLYIRFYYIRIEKRREPGKKMPPWNYDTQWRLSNVQNERALSHVSLR
jgi:hypothetical protein